MMIHPSITHPTDSFVLNMEGYDNALSSYVITHPNMMIHPSMTHPTDSFVLNMEGYDITL